MAARTRKIRHDENTRDKIRVSQIINRLQNHIDGKIDLTTSQVSAANTLLRKCLPDLASTDLTVKGQLEQSIISMVADLDKPVPSTTSDSDMPGPDTTIQ